MTDCVVTVPKDIWFQWIAEGDAVGEPSHGDEWGYTTGGGRPPLQVGDRLYVVAWGKVRGYAPVTSVVHRHGAVWEIGRRGGAVACTIESEFIQGFRGWRHRWWPHEQEIQFPDWKVSGIPYPKSRDERAAANYKGLFK